MFPHSILTVRLCLFNQRRRKRHLHSVKSDFACFETSARLSRLGHLREIRRRSSFTLSLKSEIRQFMSWSCSSAILNSLLEGKRKASVLSFSQSHDIVKKSSIYIVINTEFSSCLKAVSIVSIHEWYLLITRHKLE